MPEVAKNYSITELEMCGLAINIASFSHLLKRVDFDAVVDHLAIAHIMKSKMELATNRIKRLFKILSSYSFNLYYIKGKDMVLSDFLSRQPGDNHDPHQIIPISFNIREILKSNYQDVVKDTFIVQTRSQAKSKDVKAPAVQGTTAISSHKRWKETKPIVINDNTPIVINLDNKLDIDTQSQNTRVTRPGARQTTAYANPITRPPPRPPDLVNSRNHRTDTGIDPNLDFEENSPHQERIITEIYASPDQSYIEQTQELADLVDSTKLVQKYLLKQADIDKILEIIERKVLKGTHLPLTIKEIQAGYLKSPFFKDLYRYLAQNK